MENLKVGDRVVSNYHGVNGQVVGIAEPLTIGDDTYPTIIVTHKAIFADFPSGVVLGNTPRPPRAHSWRAIFTE